MRYVAIEAFVDLQDSNHLYHPGDEFPRNGIAVVSKERIEELSGAFNKLGKAVIKATAEEPTKKTTKKIEEPAETDITDGVKALGLSRTEINRLTTAELQKMASDLGVENADEMSGGSIKRMFISALEE